MTFFKKNILFIHRWLGFISGLVVLIVSITGCLFVFQDEIQDTLYNYRHVRIQEKPYLQPSQLKQQALKQYPLGKSNITAYYGPDRPAVVMVNLPKDITRYVYVNPYNGTFLYDENIDRNFFIVVENIHLYLLLPVKIGQWVVGVSVIVFVALLITGMILWWPKRKRDRKRSFSIKWNGRWRRINYDLHNVLGFYACSIAFILAFTGLCIAFDWMNKGAYIAANMGKTYADEKTEVRSSFLHHKESSGIAVIDQVFAYARKHSPQAQMFFIVEGDGKDGSTTSVTAYDQSMHFAHNDDYTFDQYTAKPLKALMYNSKSPGMKLNEANYDIHVGQLLGLPGKIIAFMASLICASLPVTGFIVWWGKRNKKDKRKIRHRRQQQRIG